MSSKLPMDDGILELEEVEGLIQANTLTSNVGRGTTGRKATSSSCGSKLAAMCDGKYRMRWGGFLVTLAVLLVVLLMSDTETIHEESEGIVEVEGKNASHSVNVDSGAVPPAAPKATAEPKKEEHTSQPTVQATPSPTPPPTVAVTTVPPTPPPTVPPTPPPTAAATEAKASAEPATKAPTSAPTAAAKEETKKETTASATSASSAGAARIDPALITDPSKLPPAMLQRWNKGSNWRPKDYVVRNEREYDPKYLEELKKKWGTWQFVDKKADSRPKEDFFAAYPNRDIPRDKFPDNAWQTDTEYLKDFLKEADALVTRGMEAILAEYGHGTDDEPGKPFEERAAMFALEYKTFNRNLEQVQRDLGGPPPLYNGGWTTEQSFRGLVRRVLHAIMTRDTFTVILGGHSAAAGHGNLFRQSYTMQFHRVMEPIFSYLGVQLISRNLAQGGLGTLQSGLGAGSIYGDEIDILLWDSGMTEGRDGRAMDMFIRQGLIGGNRVPFLLNGDWGMLERYYREIDADVGVFGTGDEGIPTIMSEDQAKGIPYAARWVKCDTELSQQCRDHKYRANCWVERSDVQPPTKQQDRPGSQVSWHPGNRWHQLTGRVIAFWTLHALKEAVSMWSKAEGYELPDDAWHVTKHYDNIRTKFNALDHTKFPCFQYNGTIPARMCWTPMKSLTEFTPRANPLETAITRIVRPDSTGYIPFIATDMLYEGPDVHNPFLDIPEGEIDVLAILNNGRQFPEQINQRRLAESVGQRRIVPRRTANDAIVPGKGFEMSEEPPGYCDGSWNMICRREASSNCLLTGHADARGGIKFNSLSGWLVMDLPKVKEGIIALKIETWHNGVGRTSGWKAVNGERNLRRLESNEGYLDHAQHERNLKTPPPPYCDDFKFEFAIDGKITTWAGEEEFTKHSFPLQRVVEVQPLLDDENWPGEKDVELAVRMTGCGGNGSKTFRLTHIYWA